MVHLLPRYRSVVQRDPPVTKTVRDWSKESVNVLKGCFDCTEWGVFVDSSDDVCELSDVVSEYIMFCEDCVIPRKTVKIYANNKLWVTKKIKDILNMKKKVCLKRDKDEINRV